MDTTEGSAGAATTQAQQVASGAAERGKEVAASAGDKAQQVAGTARDQVSQVTTEAQAQATKVLDDAKGHLHGQARAQTEQVGEALGRLAGQLRALSDGRPEEGGQAADLVRRVAEQVEQTTDRVRQGGFDGLVADLHRFARRRPAAFMAGALTAGFAVGRMVRAGREAGSSGGAASQGCAADDQLILGQPAPEPPPGYEPATGPAYEPVTAPPAPRLPEPYASGPGILAGEEGAGGDLPTGGTGEGMPR